MWTMVVVLRVLLVLMLDEDDVDDVVVVVVVLLLVLLLLLVVVPFLTRVMAQPVLVVAPPEVLAEALSQPEVPLLVAEEVAEEAVDKTSASESRSQQATAVHPAMTMVGLQPASRELWEGSG